MPNEKPEPHTPFEHAKEHRKGIPCGCAFNPVAAGVICCECGAAYEVKEVISFPIWRCYDCGRSYETMTSRFAKRIGT